MISFMVPITPVPKGRPRFWNGRALTDRKTREFERIFRKLAAQFKPRAPLKGPIEISLVFSLAKPKSVKREYPAVRPDIDNFCKSALDALRDFWIDDGQIVDVRARKVYASEPGIGVEILEVPGKVSA